MKLRKNIGPLDRAIRLLAGNILIFMVFFGVIAGGAANLATLAAFGALLTSFLSYCPLYALLRFSTLK